MGQSGHHQGIKPADLKRFYETYMRPEQAAVIAVGDITLDELKQQLEASLGDLEVGLARSPPDPGLRLAAESEAAAGWC